MEAGCHLGLTALDAFGLWFGARAPAAAPRGRQSRAARRALLFSGRRIQPLELLQDPAKHVVGAACPAFSALDAGPAFLPAKFANPGLDVADIGAFAERLLQQRLPGGSRRAKECGRLSKVDSPGLERRTGERLTNEGDLPFSDA